MDTENGSSGSEVTGGHGILMAGALSEQVGGRDERMGSFQFYKLEVVRILELMR